MTVTQRESRRHLLSTLLAACAVTASAYGAAMPALAQEAPPVALTASFPEEADVWLAIVTASFRWNVNPQQMMRLAQCESSLNPAALGPGGTAGLFQIAPRTWQWGVATLELGDVSPYDARANAEVAAWLMATLGPGQWGCA